MSNPDIAQPGALAVPGKFQPTLRERQIFVSDIVDRGVADQFQLGALAAEIRRPRNVDHRRRIEGGVGQRGPGVRRVEQRFEIEAAASLKICSVRSPATVSSCGKAAQTTVPFYPRIVEHLNAPL